MNASLFRRFSGLCFCALSAVPRPAAAQESNPAPAAALRDQATALREFKTGLTALQKMVAARVAAAKGNPLAGLSLFGSVAAQIKALRTDGLPADLATGFARFNAVIQEMAVIFKDLPADENEMLTWLKKAGDDAAFRTSMDRLGREFAAASQQLKLTAKKYGLEKELDFNQTGQTPPPRETVPGQD